MRKPAADWDLGEGRPPPLSILGGRGVPGGQPPTRSHVLASEISAKILQVLPRETDRYKEGALDTHL
jgi:hypothetical protein